MTSYLSPGLRSSVGFPAISRNRTQKRVLVNGIWIHFSKLFSLKCGFISTGAKAKETSLELLHRFQGLSDLLAKVKVMFVSFPCNLGYNPFVQQIKVVCFIKLPGMNKASKKISLLRLGQADISL